MKAIYTVYRIVKGKKTLYGVFPSIRKISTEIGIPIRVVNGLIDGTEVSYDWAIDYQGVLKRSRKEKLPRYVVHERGTGKEVGRYTSFSDMSKRMKVPESNLAYAYLGRRQDGETYKKYIIEKI